MGHLISPSEKTSIHAGTSGGSICTLGAIGLFAGLGFPGFWIIGNKKPVTIGITTGLSGLLASSFVTEITGFVAWPRRLAAGE